MVRFVMSSFSSDHPQMEALQLHLPWTKTTRSLGADSTVMGPSSQSPVWAMKNHLRVNAGAPTSSHLFSYLHQGRWVPLTKGVFMSRCSSIWASQNLDRVSGHSFRIGGATELLLAGMPPKTVASIGRWKSLAFLLYWRRHQDIVARAFASHYDHSRLQALNNIVSSFRDSVGIDSHDLDVLAQLS
jgi:hypothetical protein